MDDGHIREICLSRVTTIEQLWKDHKKDKTSLGLIKPQLEKIIIKEKKFDKKAGNLNFQTKLEGEIIPIDILKYMLSINSNVRITAKDILVDVWIQNQGNCTEI